MRLFIALNLPDELRLAVHAAASPLRLLAPGARWTSAAKLHLTMKFLGEQPSELVAMLMTTLDTIAARHAPVALSVEGIGAFPSFRRPRVVWAGIVATPALVALHRGVDAACSVLGIARETRAFHPHVTLARIGPRVSRAAIDALAAERDHVAVHGNAVVDTLDLMQSVGGRYVPLHRAPLAG